MTDETNPGGGPSEASELPTGSTFGKYKIVRIAGRGGKGIVYEALDSVLDRKVALKVIRPEAVSDAKDLELESQRFLTEARLLANLPKHDHIVGVYEAGDLEGKRFLAMEFVEGRPMTGWRKKASVKQQVRAIREVAVAMDHAHKHGIVHRDLKPQNILVDAEGRPHVTDFGLAKKVGNQEDLNRTEAGKVWGTPTYMSPEHARNAEDLDHRSDLYAMGVMLFEALTGRPPFQGSTPQETMQQIVRQPTPKTGRFVKPEDQTPLHKALEPVVMKALEKLPENRQATAKEFADQIARAVSPTATRRSTAPAPAEIRIVQAAPPPSAGGSKTLIYGMGAAAAVAVLVLAIVLFSGGDPSQGLVAEGDGLMAARQYTQALETYQKALDLNPESPRALQGRDRAQQALEDIRRREERKKEASRRTAPPKSENDGEVERLRRQLQAAKEEATLAKVDQIKARERAEAEAKRARDAQLLAQQLKNKPPTPAPKPAAPKPATPQPAQPPAPKPAPAPAPQPAAPQPGASAPQPGATARPPEGSPVDGPVVPPTGEATVMDDGSFHWEAEDFSGGLNPVEGKDFHDTTEGNRGQRYRNGDVDIGGRSDQGFRIFMTEPGEWLHYTFKGGGRFELEVAYTYARSDEQVHIEVDGKDITGRVTLPAERNNELTTATSAYFDLPDGEHHVRFCFDSGQIYLDWFRLKKITLLAIPDEADQKKAEDVIHDLFKSEYSKRSAIDLRLLAQSLLEQGRRTEDDPAARYVFFREARDVSVKAGDATTAFTAIDEMARQYTIEPLQMKLDVLDGARRMARTVDAAKSLVESYLVIVDDRIAAEDYEEAASLISKAESPARATKDAALLGEIRSRSKDLADMAKEFRPVKSALAKLESRPDDSTANQTVGMYRCFTRDDWAAGLPYLAKSKDSKLAELAKEELEAPTEPRAQADLGKAWMDAGKRKSSELRNQYYTRALHWYEMALAQATSLVKIKIESEVNELYKALAGTGMLRRGLVFWMEPARDSRAPFRDHAASARTTLAGSPTYDASTRSLDSSRGGVEYSVSPAIQSVGQNGTMSVWLRDENMRRAQGTLFFRANRGQSTNFSITMNREEPVLWLNWPTNRNGFLSNARVPEGEWAHLVVVWNEKQAMFYLNGDLTRTVDHTGGPTDKGNRVGVGVDSRGRGNYFTGNIGQVLVYNRALPHAEIRQLFLGGRSQFR